MEDQLLFQIYRTREPQLSTHATGWAEKVFHKAFMKLRVSIAELAGRGLAGVYGRHRVGYLSTLVEVTCLAEVYSRFWAFCSADAFERDVQGRQK